MAVKTKAAKNEQATLDKIVALLEQVEELNSKAEKLMQKHGISEMLAEAAELKKAATALTVEAEFKSILMPSGARYDLRQDTYNKRIIGDAEDLAGVKTPEGVIPLRKILNKKFDKKAALDVWRSVTTRKVDEAKLTQAVNEGTLTLDEITPAYYHDLKSPYLRRYE